MKKRTIWRVITTALVCLGSAYFFWPLSKVKLGLDLRGGVHFVLEVESEEALKFDLKDTRDRLMQRLSEAEPHYGFAQHAGYGTLAHRQALILNGPGAFHRLTFAPIKNLALPR